MTRLNIVFMFCFLLVLAPLSVAAQERASAFRSTDLPLPRFVSLKSHEVFLRSGPGMRYPVQWVYRRTGWPVEIILEFDNWRKIRDHDGETGWVHQSLLSGERTGMIKSQTDVSLFSRAETDGKLRAVVEDGVLVELESCKPGWCKVAVEGYRGWVERKFIWGIYEGENFD